MSDLIIRSSPIPPPRFHLVRYFGVLATTGFVRAASGSVEVLTLGLLPFGGAAPFAGSEHLSAEIYLHRYPAAS